MEKPAAIDSEDNLFVLSNLPPTRAQKRLAFAIVVAMFVTFFIAAGAAFAHPATPRRRLRPGLYDGDRPERPWYECRKRRRYRGLPTFDRTCGRPGAFLTYEGITPAKPSVLKETDQ